MDTKQTHEMVGGGVRFPGGGCSVQGWCRCSAARADIFIATHFPACGGGGWWPASSRRGPPPCSSVMSSLPPHTRCTHTRYSRYTLDTLHMKVDKELPVLVK